LNEVISESRELTKRNKESDEEGKQHKELYGSIRSEDPKKHLPTVSRDVTFEEDKIEVAPKA
jgi:hypothetical protein